MHVDLTSSAINLGKIYLENKSLDIETVHVHTHTIHSSQISDIILSGKDLNNNLTGNIANTLSHQPNIGVNSFGAATSKPVVRGYSGDRFLLTKDGTTIGDLSQSSIDHAITLDMTEISKIEVVRGPKSLLYGPNTIGGVLNASIIGNPRVRVNKFFKTFLMGGESFNDGLYGKVMFYIPIKNNQINLFINNRYTDNQTSPIGELDNTYSQTSNYKIGYTRYNNHNYINLIIEKYNMDYGIPGSIEGHIDGVDINVVKNTFQINFHSDISFNNFNQFDMNYSLIDYEHKEFENNLDYSTVALARNTHNIKVKMESPNTIIGSDFTYKQFSPSGYYWTPTTNELDLSLYGFNEKELKYFNFLSSFRVGYLLIDLDNRNISFSNLDSQEVKNRNFKYLSSSFGLQKYFDNFELSSWLISTMKAPKIEDLYSDGPHLGAYSYEIGEPNLKLEEIYGIESSASYSTQELHISLTTFYNYSPYYHQMTKMGECSEEYISGSHPCAGADFIEWGSGPGWLYKYQIKGLESLIKGLEFKINYTYQKFNISYDFSLVRGDDLTNVIPLSYINPDKQIFIIEYQEELMNYKLRLSNIHSQNRLGEFETYTPSSFITDFIISYNYRNQNISFQCNNIFNVEYYNHLSKIKSIMPEFGRNVAISYKILL